MDRPTPPRSVLFVCRLNAVRSPMAEILAGAMLGRGVFVASAGVRSGGEPDPFVEAVLAEDGLPPPLHQPRTLEDVGDTYFDLIVTLAPEAHHAALDLTRSMAVDVEYWPTADPTAARGSREQILAAYRDVRDRLRARIGQRFGPRGGAAAAD